MEIGNRVKLQIDGQVENVEENEIVVSGMTIDLSKVISCVIVPEYNTGKKLYASRDIFYIKISTGDWVYSENGSVVTEEYVKNINGLVEERPE